MKFVMFWCLMGSRRVSMCWFHGFIALNITVDHTAAVALLLSPNNWIYFWIKLSLISFLYSEFKYLKSSNILMHGAHLSRQASDNLFCFLPSVLLSLEVRKIFFQLWNASPFFKLWRWSAKLFVLSLLLLSVTAIVFVWLRWSLIVSS